ncbi:DUF6286 domain-containing protein [Amycolatopsis sp. PS_44_ISF1]|uniref:DUF6286 domain-containing protein n=1 Tax=Amycolatopsis sp. PS_44_ISF1 TaxID=2974917 RepID=UPI0028DE3229|nr:DUF6286 domain-containing protein [Amycolatopsis sp. PS_44_ISF1]MDT8910021.1 alkaline shock response membrane anchor protein AmaP [Amycolatopsis sp. PS_44_ISF1]
MKRRPRRSVPATLTALVILAVCVFAAAVSIQLIIGEKPWISYAAVTGWLHDRHWTDPIPGIAGGVAALLGLILLLAAVLPGKATVLPLRGDLDSGASRRSYRSTLRTAASSVEGVSGAKVKLGGRRVKAVVTTARTNTDGLAEAVRTAVEQRVGQIDPVTPPAVKVRLKTSGSTS